MAESGPSIGFFFGGLGIGLPKDTSSLQAEAELLGFGNVLIFFFKDLNLKNSSKKTDPPKPLDEESFIGEKCPYKGQFPYLKKAHKLFGFSHF